MSTEGRRRFALGPCLGRGGYGEVYRATMLSTGGLSSPVALKLVRHDLDVGPDAISRLRDEARILARLAHPNIVRVIDLCGVTDDEGTRRIALITELVDGRDLDFLRRPPDAIGPRAAAEVIARVARALDAAWSTLGTDHNPLRVVHRDVKPGNIAVGRHGDVKLLDFGIARFEGEEREARTATAMLVGSLPYLAPERFLEREATSACDIFGLGCVFFECVAGEAWYGSVTPRAIPALATDRDRYEAWRWERLAGADLDPAIRPLLENTLAWEHSERMTAAELADRLDGLELAGPSLRAWCRQRAWPNPVTSPGSLEGRTLFEASLELPHPAAAPGPVPIGVPKLVHRPLATVDPGGFSGPQPSRSPERPAVLPDKRGPSANRAAPVVPSGQHHAPFPPGTEFIPLIPARHAERTAPSVPAAPKGGAPRIVAGVGCLLVVFLAIGATILAASGVLGAIAWLD